MVDKILVFGDSIAYGKWDEDGGWVSRLRKFIDSKHNVGKGGNVQVYNFGIPGDVVPRIVSRVENELNNVLIDTIDIKTLIIFAAGINDSNPHNWFTKKQTPKKDFVKSIEKMISIYKKYDCEIAFIGLTPVNDNDYETKFTNKNAKIYDMYLTEVCKSKNVLKLELYEDLASVGFDKMLVDAVHPNSEGHKLMSEKIIKFLQKNFDI